MRIAGWTTIIYAVIVFVGGLVGHSLAGSNASLIAGIVFSILLVISGLGLLAHKKFGAIFALANFVNPKPREMTVTIPADRFLKK